MISVAILVRKKPIVQTKHLSEMVSEMIRVLHRCVAFARKFARQNLTVICGQSA